MIFDMVAIHVNDEKCPKHVWEILQYKAEKKVIFA